MLLWCDHNKVHHAYIQGRKSSRLLSLLMIYVLLSSDPLPTHAHVYVTLQSISDSYPLSCHLNLCKEQILIWRAYFQKVLNPVWPKREYISVTVYTIPFEIWGNSNSRQPLEWKLSQNLQHSLHTCTYRFWLRNHFFSNVLKVVSTCFGNKLFTSSLYPCCTNAGLYVYVVWYY